MEETVRRMTLRTSLRSVLRQQTVFEGGSLEVTCLRFFSGVPLNLEIANHPPPPQGLYTGKKIGICPSPRNMNLFTTSTVDSRKRKCTSYCCYQMVLLISMTITKNLFFDHFLLKIRVIVRNFSTLNKI